MFFQGTLQKRLTLNCTKAGTKSYDRKGSHAHWKNKKRSVSQSARQTKDLF